MELETRQVSNWTVVTPPTSRLDTAHATEFKTKLADLVESGCDNIGLDLTAVEYVDSAGLGAIVHILKLVRRRGNFVLIGLSDKVLGLLELTGLDKVFDMASSVDDLVSIVGEQQR